MEKRLPAAIMALLLCAVPFARPALASDSTQLIAAMRALPAQSDKFRSMMSNLNASQFRLVSVQSVLSAGDEAAYRSSLKKQASVISDLRDTLSHTTVTGSDGVVASLKNVLLAKNVTIDRIVGIFVGSDGSITLFYQ